MRFVHHMYDSESSDEVATTELVGVCFDTANRVSVEWPGFVHEHAASLAIQAAVG